MKRRWMACGFLVALALVVAVGIVYLLLGRGRLAQLTTDPSYALIESPPDKAILFVDDPVYVQISAMLTHRDFGGVKLFVDGGEYVPDEASQPYAPKNKVTCTTEDPKFCGSAVLSLLWRPANPGPHTLSACVLGDPNAAAAWKICTENVKVVVTDLSAPPEIGGTYAPQAGDTVESIAGKFGLPPSMVAAANPELDPAKALPSDATVFIPAAPYAAPGGAAPGSGSGPWTVTTLTVTADQAIDKGYCYYSLGSDYWTRVPAGAQTFVYPLDGTLDMSSESSGITIPAGGGTLAMECWGWSGATLVPLGTGKTSIAPSSGPNLQLVGDHFSLEATLEPIGDDLETMGGLEIIPPPRMLKSTGKLDVCVKHFPPMDFFFGPMACKVAVENGDIVLLWEWLVPAAPPSTPKASWQSKIDGYRVYQVPAGGKPSLVASIPIAEKKVLILPRSWGGSRTFLVRAYAGPFESANSNVYTLGAIEQGLATVRIEPDWVFADWTQYLEDDCQFSAGGTGGPELGLPDKWIVVGFQHISDEDCIENLAAFYQGSMEFPLSSIKGPVSKALLEYVQEETFWKNNDGLYLFDKTSCADSLNIITAFSTGGVEAFDPYLALPAAGFPGHFHAVDVTAAVRDWMDGVYANQGFVFVGRDESLPEDRSDVCWSKYRNFTLTVTYFTK